MKILHLRCITFFSMTFLVVNSVQGGEQMMALQESELDEDRRVLKESIAKFGSPQNFEDYGLPGPELAVDGDKLSYENLLPAKSENYTFRYRTVMEHFSYNGLYEEVKTKIIGNEQIIWVKGQVTEKIPKKSGGYYLRTTGYESDENGFRWFLIDITKVQTDKYPVINYPEQSEQASVKIATRGGITPFQSLSGATFG